MKYDSRIDDSAIFDGFAILYDEKNDCMVSKACIMADEVSGEYITIETDDKGEIVEENKKGQIRFIDARLKKNRPLLEKICPLFVENCITEAVYSNYSFLQ